MAVFCLLSRATDSSLRGSPTSHQSHHITSRYQPTPRPLPFSPSSPPPIPTHRSFSLQSFLLRSFTSPSFSLLILRSTPVSTPDCPPYYPEIRSARSPLRTGTSRLTSSFLKRTFCILIRWARVLQHPKTMAGRLKIMEYPDQPNRMKLRGARAHRLKMYRETEIVSTPLPVDQMKRLLGFFEGAGDYGTTSTILRG